MKKTLLITLMLLAVRLLVGQIIIVPFHQPTIQAGINAANVSDTVLVLPGTYFENIEIVWNVTLASLYLTTQDTSYISQTLIDGSLNTNGYGNVVTVYDSPKIFGFTVVNDTNTVGGGILVEGPGSPHFENLIVKNNNSVYGGGFRISEGSAYLKNVTIKNNTADSGGGIYCIGSNVTLENVLIEGNHVNAEGGGLYCENSELILNNVDFINNIRASGWAGLYGGGGGLFCRDSSNIILKNVNFIENTATSRGGGTGGGLHCEDSYLYLENVNFRDNYSKSFGADIYCLRSNPILISANFNNDTIYSSINKPVGRISLFDSNPVFKNIFIRNSNLQCLIVIWNSNPIFMNTTIADNITVYETNKISCTFGSHPTFINSIIRGDTIVLSDSSSITFSHCNIENGDTGIINNGTGIINWLAGNIDEYPMFLGTGEHPYQLSTGSPCIDAGTADTTGLNLPLYDMLGNERIFDGDGDSFDVIDMGAYEFDAPLYNEASILQLPEMKALCFPNPFSTSTTISFEIEKTALVNISIYNQQGQLIEKTTNTKKPAGEHNIQLDTKNWLPGLYLCRLQMGDEFTTKKIIKIAGS